MKKILIGIEEQLTLPDLGIDVIARIDTGAKTSALHVEHLEVVRINGKRHAQFALHPDTRLSNSFCLPLLAMRKIKSSNGAAESRPVIKTHLVMNGHRWMIELTLTNRDNMQYPMLLGREAMGSRVLVDPAAMHLLE